MSDCTCNVYAADGSGRVVAWRSWNCPVHQSDPPPEAAQIGSDPCHVTGCDNPAVGGEIGECGDLLLCAVHIGSNKQGEVEQ